MNDMIKICLTEILYHDLGLNRIEDILKNKRIPHKTIQNPNNYPLVSKYFFLLNDVHFENLTPEEKKQLDMYYNRFLQGGELEKTELYQFLNDKKMQLLLKKDKDDYTYYGPISPYYCAKNDTIVFSFDFIEFDDENPVSDEDYQLISDMLGKIENEFGPQSNIKVKFIESNEVSLESMRVL